MDQQTMMEAQAMNQYGKMCNCGKCGCGHKHHGFRSLVIVLGLLVAFVLGIVLGSLHGGHSSHYMRGNQQYQMPMMRGGYQLNYGGTMMQNSPRYNMMQVPQSVIIQAPAETIQTAPQR